MESSSVVLLFLLLLYHHRCSPPLPPHSLLFSLLFFIFLLLLSPSLSSSYTSSCSSLSLLLLLPGVAAAAVPPEASQEVRPEAAEGAGVASRPVGGADVLLQTAGEEEGAFAVLTAVRTLHVVAAHHVTDGETCKDTHREALTHRYTCSHVQGTWK